MSQTFSLGLLATAAMVVGAPLVYADQAYSIARRRNSEGFSKDVCAVLLLANIARIFWWLKVKFEFALLLQSLLMIASQLGVLSLILRFQPDSFASSAYTASSEDYRYGDSGPAVDRRTPPARRRPQTPLESPTPTQHMPEPPNAAIRPAENPSMAKYASPGLRALFGSIGSSPHGQYIPALRDFRFPDMPTLDTFGGFERIDGEANSPPHEQEENTEPVSLPIRVARRAVKLSEQAARHLKALLGVRNDGSLRKDGSSSSRPFGFWTWRHLSSYVFFLVAFALLLLILHFVLSRSPTYSFLLGLFALGLESALPVPQFLSNQQRRSLAGFRMSVLGGWLIGDAFKTVYFVVNSSPIQFIWGGAFALCVDIAIMAQMYYFRELTQQDEEAKRLAEEARVAEQARASYGLRHAVARPTPTKPAFASQGLSLATQAAAATNSNARDGSYPSAAATTSSLWTSEHADLDDNPVIFDPSGPAGQGKHQMFTIEPDDE